MTYQPYPTGDAGSISQQLPRAPERPQSVRIAVILMYAGAALSAVSLVLTLAFVHGLQSAIATSLRHSKIRHYTAAQIHSVLTSDVVAIVVLMAVTIGLWVWMAWINNRGRGWARIMASVFFAANSISVLLFLLTLRAPTLIYGLGWIIGLFAVIFLWTRDTTQYIAGVRSHYLQTHF